MPLTSDMREPIAAAVGTAVARLAGTDATVSHPAAVPAAPALPVIPVIAPAEAVPFYDEVVPVVPVPRNAPEDAEVDIPALLRELRSLASAPDLPGARHADLMREVQQQTAG